MWRAMHAKSGSAVAFLILWANLVDASFVSSIADWLKPRHQPGTPEYPPSFEVFPFYPTPTCCTPLNDEAVPEHFSLQVAYNFTLPYEREYLPDGLTFPARIWRDEDARKIRMDTYGGVNSLIATEGVNLEIAPRIDELKCAKFKVDPGELGLFSVSILPDVRRWNYIGHKTVQGQHAHGWEYSKRHGDKETRYKFYAAKDGTPLRLHMHGNDAFSGAHFDIWVVDYYDYQPGKQDSSIFDPPPSCKDTEIQQSLEPRSFPSQMLALIPTTAFAHDELAYNRLQNLGKLGMGREEDPLSAKRHKALQDNFNIVQSHNSKANESYSLEMNRFSAWTQEEFEAIMLPRHAQKRGMVTRGLDARRQPSAEIPYKRLAPKGTLPGSVDWRGSLANDVVKDQAACGSCWAFGATGVLESAHLLATGKRALFSEQQMMDCSWGYGLNKACDGGDYDAAMDYLKHAGGLIQEEGYEYLGADGFCRDRNFSSEERTAFEGYSYVPSGDDEALMEAVYSRGPIAVSLDASQPGFRFYSEGILDEPNCLWKSEDLDHAVLLVGYGTCPVTGKDYWLIKNSWSTYWGDKGYIKIARAHHGCGISTDPVYAVFNSERPVDSS